MANIYSSFDKQIYFTKIIIGEACPFRCKYCFVDKENGNTIKISTLKKIIDLLLYSPGQNKLLHLLGGEPLLFLGIIKEAVLYARSLAKELNKDLDISFCTTGLYFDDENLQFIRDSSIYLAWSIDGPSEIHNKNRVNITGNGTFEDIIVKKNKVIQYIKNSHLGIAMTIDENTVDNLYDSYQYLVNKEDFTCTINIAPVDGKEWKEEKQKKFISELICIYEYILKEIEEGRFLYLNALNKEFRFHMLSVLRGKGRCLWFYAEAFSNGDILFNPFVNKEEDYSRYVVGNVNSNTFYQDVQKYIGCRFDYQSEKCITCKNEYGKLDNTLVEVRLNKLLSYRDRISIYYANKIRMRALKESNFSRYIDIAKNQMYV